MVSCTTASSKGLAIGERGEIESLGGLFTPRGGESGTKRLGSASFDDGPSLVINEGCGGARCLAENGTEAATQYSTLVECATSPFSAASVCLFGRTLSWERTHVRRRQSLAPQACSMVEDQPGKEKESEKVTASFNGS